MIKVVIARDVYAPDTWTTADVADLQAYLKSTFDTWPATARLYHEHIALDHDITPTDAAGVDRLATVEGTVFVLIYPAGLDPITIALIASAISLVVSLAVVFLVKPPALPDTGAQPSSNNELSARVNKPRVNGRVPDIFGTVTSTPDLIAPPYIFYENDIAVEHAIMAIGRGHFEVTNVRDGDTSILQISGASVAVYPPAVDIASGVPQLQIGDPIAEAPLMVTKSNSVNGQTLPPPNYERLAGTEFYLLSPNKIQVRNSAEAINFGDYFNAGESIVLTGAVFGADNFDGTFIVTSTGTNELVLSNPAAVNPTWSNLAMYSMESTESFTPRPTITIDGSLENYLGWFVLSQAANTGAIINFYAQGGLYSISAKGGQFAQNVTIKIEYQQIDDNDNPIGAIFDQSITLMGSRISKDSIGKTVKIDLPFAGRARLRFLRTSRVPVNEYDGDQFITDVKLRDLYAFSPLQKTLFDDVTVVRSRSVATDGALSVKERKLNMLVTRKLPTFDAQTGQMTTTLNPTNSAADAIASVCLDTKIGRRTITEIDLAQIYATIADVSAYFGTPMAAEFCYTFDQPNQSFEEIVSTIAQAVFCEAYRQGNKIMLHFERQTDASVLLFNHRNKVPKSEKRTLNFGMMNDFDGVEYHWVDPKDDAKVVLKVPNDTINNPKKIESAGVRNERQAYFSAWRVWNKLKYQRESVEFEALRESDLLLRSDRILIADNTRTGTQDGEIVAQNGLIVTTSQPLVFESGKTYTIHLQLFDGSIDAIGCAAGADEYSAIFARPPTLPLVLESDRYIKTLYVIAASNDPTAKPFLVVEKSNASRMTNMLKAINYDDRYYQNDTDYLMQLID